MEYRSLSIENLMLLTGRDADFVRGFGKPCLCANMEDAPKELATATIKPFAYNVHVKCDGHGCEVFESRHCNYNTGERIKVQGEWFYIDSIGWDVDKPDMIILYCKECV